MADEVLDRREVLIQAQKVLEATLAQMDNRQTVLAGQIREKELRLNELLSDTEVQEQECKRRVEKAARDASAEEARIKGEIDFLRGERQRVEQQRAQAQIEADRAMAEVQGKLDDQRTELSTVSGLARGAQATLGDVMKHLRAVRDALQGVEL